jgi:hypothetical protein
MNKFAHPNSPRRKIEDGKIGDVLDIFTFRNP